MTSVNHRSEISMKASKIEWSPKKSGDQIAFNASCIENHLMAVLLFLFFEVHKRYSVIPIKRYNAVQTGPKTQLGGLNTGFSSVEYQLLRPS